MVDAAQSSLVKVPQVPNLARPLKSRYPPFPLAGGGFNGVRTYYVVVAGRQRAENPPARSSLFEVAHYYYGHWLWYL